MHYWQITTLESKSKSVKKQELDEAIEQECFWCDIFRIHDVSGIACSSHIRRTEEKVKIIPVSSALGLFDIQLVAPTFQSQSDHQGGSARCSHQ